MPLISVVLPFHNAAKTIAQAIDSIRAQTFPDWELLLVDDGSNDGSSAIAQSCSNADQRIRVVGNSERVGIVEALRRACLEARGTFVARMDADDVAHPMRFARQLEVMRNEPAVDLCGCHVRAIGDAQTDGGMRYYAWLNSIATPADIERELFVECPIAHPTFLFRLEQYHAVGGYQDHGWPEDYDLILRFWSHRARIANVPEPLLEWRHSTNRLSLTDTRYAPERFRALKRRYLETIVLAGIANGSDQRSFVQWGGGETGKPWLREWTRPPAAVVDVNQRKIGSYLHGIPVIAPDELPSPGQSYILIAVGAPGAREIIRDWLTPRGYKELDDYRFIA